MSKGEVLLPSKLRPRTRRRYRRELMFRAAGIVALSLSALALAVLMVNIFSKGYSAFLMTKVSLEVEYSPELLGTTSETPLKAELERLNYTAVVKKALYDVLSVESPSLSQKREMGKMLSASASQYARDRLLEDPTNLGKTVFLNVPINSNLDQLRKGNIKREWEASSRKISDQQLVWFDTLQSKGRITQVFNWNFLGSGDSRDPEMAGIGGAIMGSLFTLLVCFLLSFPVGVAAALYLEEFAPKNRITEIIEVNINNLAAVPSIIFGLLGLAIFLNIFGMPRSTPLVGGTVLALMTLPTIIIACRASLKAVPPSIRHGALAMGASPVQVVFHHVLPLALPGTLTGTIIGLAQALGETAPLLMIGMVAFIVDVPATPLDPSAALPVQIYLWAESAERGFVEKTSAAIMVILTFLIIMNASAVYIRGKLERRW